MQVIFVTSQSRPMIIFRSLKMSMIRRGGSFNTVSVQWMVQSNGSDQNDDLVKILRSTSGSFTFKPNQSRADVNLEIIPNSIPEETKLLAFRQVFVQLISH